MRLLLERISSGKHDTVGRLLLDGKLLCYTLEDEHRDVKVKGETCIPEGAYEIKFRTDGTHHFEYASGHYGKFIMDHHHGMLHLQNVPNFQFILIHIGNTDKDTDGCILLGTTAHLSKTEKQRLDGSKMAYEKVYPIIAEALLKGEKVYIQIKTVG